MLDFPFSVVLHSITVW